MFLLHSLFHEALAIMIELLSSSALCAIQDAGRPGFRRLGIPPAGAIYPVALRLANRLLENAADMPALECLQGARLRVLQTTLVALAGVGYARAWRALAGELIEITPALPGVWHYLALPGGIDAPHWFGSASVCRRAAIGAVLPKGAVLNAHGDSLNAWPTGVVARQPAAPLLSAPETLRLWPGPQWHSFGAAARKRLLTQAWRISMQSDRSGYRLEGASLPVPHSELASEPVRIGAIQVPPDGQPIVCLNDGPTVGGYHKIAVIDPADLRWLVQTRAGTTVRFTMTP